LGQHVNQASALACIVSVCHPIEKKTEKEQLLWCQSDQPIENKISDTLTNNLQYNAIGCRFYRAMLHTARTLLSQGVCLPVRLSHCTESKWLNIFSNFFHHHSSFSTANIMAIFRRVPPNRASNASEVRKKLRFLVNISLNLGNDTRQIYSYYGMQIGNSTHAFE